MDGIMHLLVATDGTEQAQRAVEMAAILAENTPCRVTLLTVVRQAAQREQGEKLLAAASARLETAVPTRHTLLRIGQPANRILATAVAARYDLLIVGQPATPGVLSWLRGSTLSRILASAPCPTLVVKGPVRPLRRVLLCEAGVQPSLLERLMAQLAPLLHADVSFSVLHVMSQISAGPGVPGWQLRAPAERLIQAHTDEGQLLQQDVEQLQAAHRQTQPVIRHGFVVDEILAEAQRGDYDLVLIGAHHSAGWERLLLADLTQQIVSNLDRSVLVMR